MLKAHPRTLIRQALVGRLKDLPSIDSRVYENRLKPLFAKHLPCLLVYAIGEEIEEGSYQADGHAALSRNLSLGIEAVMVASNQADENLDALALAIETKLDGWWIPGFEPSILQLREVDFAVIEAGEQPFLACRMTYEISYLSERQLSEPGLIASLPLIPKSQDLDLRVSHTVNN